MRRLAFTYLLKLVIELRNIFHLVDIVILMAHFIGKRLYL